MSLENKIAIITGAANGTGYAIAEHFSRQHAKVIVADINSVAGKKAARKLQKLSSATFVQCDVSQRLDVHNLVATALDIHGRIDVLINNAAIVNSDDFLSIKEKDFNHVLDVNLKGSFLCAQAVAKQMVRAIKKGEKPGTIINLSSVNAIFAIASQIPDTISNGGLSPLTKVMALSLAQYGIRVNAIAPGAPMSKILRATIKDLTASHEKDAPPSFSKEYIDQITDPKKIARIAEYLVSDKAADITGKTLWPNDLQSDDAQPNDRPSKTKIGAGDNI